MPRPVEAAGSHDARRIVDHDLAFHSAIVALLDNSRFDEFYSELTQELRFYLMVLSVEYREFAGARSGVTSAGMPALKG